MAETSGSSGTTQSEQTIENLLNKARASISKKEIKEAIGDILTVGSLRTRSVSHSRLPSNNQQAIDFCSCNKGNTKQVRHGKDKSCHLKQFVNGVRSKDLDAIYDVANSPCSCGFAWPSCSSPKHLEAIDLLTESLETEGHYVSAITTGLGIIRLRPISAAVSLFCRPVAGKITNNCQRAIAASQRPSGSSLSSKKRERKPRESIQRLREHSQPSRRMLASPPPAYIFS